MATVTSVKKSVLPIADYVYTITGIVAGAAQTVAVSLPTPPAAGSFPPLADWTPTVFICIPSATGTGGTFPVSVDTTSVTNTAGLIAFNLMVGTTTGFTNITVTIIAM